jgi:hypothetical protein
VGRPLLIVPQLLLGNAPFRPSSAWAPLFLPGYLPRAPGPRFALPSASAFGLLAPLVPAAFLLRRPDLVAQRFTQFTPPLLLAHQAAVFHRALGRGRGPGSQGQGHHHQGGNP